MNDLALVERTVSYEQLRAGELDKLPARVLLLPYSVALSPEESEAVRRWVRAGGTVIADLDPGIMTTHCRTLPQGQLDDVFGIDRAAAQLKTPGKDEVWEIAAPGGAALPVTRVQVGLKGPARPLWKAGVTGSVGATGSASATVGATGFASATVGATGFASVSAGATGSASVVTGALAKPVAPESAVAPQVPVLFRNTFGRGKAYYFACDAFGAYGQLRIASRTLEANPGYQFYLDALAAILKEAGVAAALRPVALDDKGQIQGWLNFWNTGVKQSGTQRYFVLTRDHGIAAHATPDVRAAMLLERPAFLYDVLAGVELGVGSRLDMSLHDGTVRVIAALPYRVGRVRLELPEQAVVGQDCTAGLTIETEGGQPELHVFRLDVIGPDGLPRRGYSQNVVATSGTAKATVPFALNDPPGAWTLLVRDVASGASARRTLSLVTEASK